MQKTFLERYPGLREIAASFTSDDSSLDAGDSLQRLVRELCQGISQEQSANSRIIAVQKALSHWLQTSFQAEADFSELLPYMADYGVALPNLLADIAEEAVLNGHGLRYANELQKVARRVSDPLCSFLAAWIFLNLGQISCCIDECRRVRIPYGPIQSLLGQALMENLQIEAAIAALQGAVRISPEDLMSWFLLAKAHFSIDHLEAAWDCILVCQKLSPDHLEVKTLMAMIAIDGDHNSQQLEAAWDTIFPPWSLNPSHGLLTVLLYRLAFELQSAAKADQITSSAAWESLRNDPEFIQYLSEILKNFSHHQWLAENQRLLQQLSPDSLSKE